MTPKSSHYDSIPMREVSQVLCSDILLSMIGDNASSVCRPAADGILDVLEQTLVIAWGEDAAYRFLIARAEALAARGPKVRSAMGPLPLWVINDPTRGRC
jgi:hypothetical protein